MALPTQRLGLTPSPDVGAIEVEMGTFAVPPHCCWQLSAHWWALGVQGFRAANQSLLLSRQAQAKRGLLTGSRAALGPGRLAT